MRQGYTVPRALIESAMPTFTKLAEPDFDKSDFSAALKIMPASFKAAERMRITQAYERAFREQVQPAMASLLGFLKAEYMSACRTSSGLSALPNGAAYYRHLVRVHTTQVKFSDKLPIIPGMTAEVDILTGNKTVMSYLLKPVLKGKAYALRER